MPVTAYEKETELKEENILLMPMISTIFQKKVYLFEKEERTECCQ